MAIRARVPSRQQPVSRDGVWFVDPLIAGALAVGMSENPGDTPSVPDENSRERNIPADAFSPVFDPDVVPGEAPADKGEHQEP